MHLGVGPTGYDTPILSPIVVGALGKGPVTTWPYIAQSRGVYTWGALDAAVAFGTAHNVSVFEGHQWEPAWAVSDTSTCFMGALNVLQCPAPPANEQDWIEFVTALVNRYKSTGIQTGCSTENPQCNGVIHVYEGWNEPPYPSPMPIANFVQMETDWLSTIRTLDPHAQVCSPAFIIDPVFPSYASFMDSFFKNGGPKTYDCYDFHINATNPEVEMSLISQFRSILDSNGISSSSATIYATEAGRWGGCSTVVSDDQEQAYIGRIELLYWSNNVKRHYWYAYSTCGTLSNQPTTQTLNPAGIAYGNVESWMVGSTMTSACAIESATVWSCGLRLADGSQAKAVWNTAGSSTYSISPGTYGQYRDLDGNTNFVSGSVAIGTKPILLILEDFSMSISPASLSTPPGQSATYVVSLTSQGDFNQVVSLGCSVAPALATCSVSPSSVVVNGSGSSIANVVTVTMKSSSSKPVSPQRNNDRMIWALLLPGVSMIWFARIRRRLPGTLHILVLFTLLLGTGCNAGPGASQQPLGPTPAAVPTNCTVTVTGTSGRIQHSVAAALQLQ